MKNSNNCSHVHHQANGGGAVYGLGFIGAAFYYLQHATSLTESLIGVGKAIFWPAFFVYKMIEMYKF